MRGHTGAGLLNTRSSLNLSCGVDDMMPSILWTRHFLNSQGYGVREAIIYQDNTSAILLEKNGKASSSKHTKHISIRYFFVTNRIKKGRCFSGVVPHRADAPGDFMTKPTQ